MTMKRLGKRLPSWDKRFFRFVRFVLNKDFVWGETDCGSIALRSITAIFGVDTGVSRGRRFLMGQELSTVIEILLDLGAEEIPPLMARAGDIGVSHEDELPSVYVFLRNGLLTTTQEDGVHIVNKRNNTDHLRVFRLP